MYNLLRLLSLDSLQIKCWLRRIQERTDSSSTAESSGCFCVRRLAGWTSTDGDFSEWSFPPGKQLRSDFTRRVSFISQNPPALFLSELLTPSLLINVSPRRQTPLTFNVRDAPFEPHMNGGIWWTEWCIYRGIWYGCRGNSAPAQVNQILIAVQYITVVL